MFRQSQNSMRVEREVQKAFADSVQIQGQRKFEFDRRACLLAGSHNILL